MPKLTSSFYTRHDVTAIARQLLGKHLFTNLHGEGITGGVIVETEAYAGPEDRASHAYRGRRTRRTEVMFHSGGVAYVYLCYGMHALLNVVTHGEGVPHAVLIRAIQPTHGIAVMLRRRSRKTLDCALTAGPARLTRSLGIDTGHNGTPLTGNRIWIEDRGDAVPAADVVASPRVGVAYAGPHAKRPWRFRIRDNPWTSPSA